MGVYFKISNTIFTKSSVKYKKGIRNIIHINALYRTIITRGTDLSAVTVEKDI